jgi:thiamine kinase-like enzyme
MPSIEEVVASAATFADREVDIEDLSGGLTNTNHLVTADGDRYVVRIPGRSTELLAVDRRNERHNAEAAATTGVSPRIVEYLEGWNVMILEYIEGTTMSAETLRTREQARRIAASLRRLHTAPRFLNDFDMFRLTEFYLRVCDERAFPVPDGFRDRLGRVGEIERAFASNPVEALPCHNDLLAENYIDDGERLWIVDFEYSGNNDPCEAYFGSAREDLLARMNLQAVMADVGWTLWAAIQAEISDIDFDFWGWAVERWDRAVAAFDGGDLTRWVGAAGAPS